VGFFSRRLTLTQEGELEEFSRTLEIVQQQCEEAFSQMLNNTKDLVAILSPAGKVRNVVAVIFGSSWLNLCFEINFESLK
jgi:hypothetical protein